MRLRRGFEAASRPIFLSPNFFGFGAFGFEALLLERDAATALVD
jgi:hypothetical protein